MKAVRFHEYGEHDVLRYEDADRPAAADGQVLVRVAGTTFNPVDAAIRAGYMREAMPVTLPHTPGIDLSGTVEGTGEAVIAFLPMLADGASAEYVVVDRALLAAAPTNVPLADTAALPSSALTAWQAVFEHADIRPGQRVLVNGGGGAVGGYAIQLAAQAGAYVIATAGPRSRDAVRAHGASEVIDYTAGPIRVGEPVDAVLHLARADASTLVEQIRPGGVLVSTVGPVEAGGAAGIRVVPMGVRSDAAQLTEIVHRVEAGTLRLDISARYRLPDLPEVHALGEKGGFRGKVVVTVGE
ncbi:NADP-dependent oxidoreductase [Paractinoplanes globisporus]|uniref:NADP-dependent oxidoreductase n=1 Tax=Paractinoplanes globisporus TaxID=113565 RepID=A0ABW6W7E5_9ACTN|nr:NADP-dependent oxidoreductase [Actinoplanes globisporus]